MFKEKRLKVKWRAAEEFIQDEGSQAHARPVSVDRSLVFIDKPPLLAIGHQTNLN
jgi:hypothetical protein